MSVCNTHTASAAGDELLQFINFYYELQYEVSLSLSLVVGVSEVLV